MFVATLLGLVAGFIVSPDLAGYPMIATEELLRHIRYMEVREYLLVGTFIGVFSIVSSALTKVKNFVPYASIVTVVLLYLTFEAYRIQGEVFFYNFIQIEYLAFYISAFGFCAVFQWAKYLYSNKNT